MAYNLAQVPALADLYQADLNILAYDTAQPTELIGGAVCEGDWGWLFVDTLWVHEKQRRRGLGAQLLAAAENAALERSLLGVHLMTSSFQALPFYQKQGYTVFGYNRERPRGHVIYYLHKRNLQAQATSARLILQEPPVARDTDAVEQGLIAYNDAYTPLQFSTHAVWLRDPDDNYRLMGGLYGVLWWDWFDVHYLWIDAQVRRQGYGAQMLAMLEGFCRARGVQGIVCDCADFQVVGFYQTQGFEVFGTLRDRPPGHTSYFLQKLL